MLESYDWVTLDQPNPLDVPQAIQPVSFLAEKVFDIHKDSVYLAEFQFKIPFAGNPPYTYESIVFSNGALVQNSINIAPHLSDPHLIHVSYDLQIPFVLTVVDEKNNYFISSGYLPKLHLEMVLHCPHKVKKHDFNIIVETQTKSVKHPRLEFDQITFAIESQILTKLTGPVQLLVPDDSTRAPSSTNKHPEENPSLLINPIDHSKDLKLFVKELHALKKKVEKETLKTKQNKGKIDKLEKKVKHCKKELKYLKEMLAQE